MHRPSKNEYFMELANIVSERTTCLRRSVGAVLVFDDRVLSTGYNGPPKGLAHCSEVGCIRDIKNIPSGTRHDLCRGVHAEQNAIIQASTAGVSTKGAILYCTHTPCALCTKLIINSKIKKVIYQHQYDDPLAKALLAESGIKLVHMEMNL